MYTFCASVTNTYHHLVNHRFGDHLTQRVGFLTNPILDAYQYEGMYILTQTCVSFLEKKKLNYWGSPLRNIDNRLNKVRTDYV